MAKKKPARTAKTREIGSLLAKVKQHITAKKRSWDAGETSVSTLTKEQQDYHVGLAVDDRELALMGAKWDANEAFYQGAVGPLAVPAAIDWRNQGGKDWVKPVKNQGVCQSCVAFAVIGAIESNLRIASQSADLELNFSEAELFSCGGGQCGSGWQAATALEICKVRGVVAESVVPYRDVDIPCPNIASPRQRIVDWRRIDTTAGVKQEIAESGPVVWGMKVFRDFYVYQGGIYSYVTGDQVGAHAILVVGYDDGQQCWICRNSWGAGWGKNENPPGYFRIAYGDPSLRGTLSNGQSFAFDAYSVVVSRPTTVDPANNVTPPNSRQQYVPELTQTILAARKNPALNAYLKYWVCGWGTQPARVEALHTVATRVRAVMQSCPESYRVWFCENL